MANPGSFKNFNLVVTLGKEAVIPPYRLVTHASIKAVKAAVDPEKPIFGATQELGGGHGRVDVCVTGRPVVDAGGTITAGEPLTCDDAGKAIKSEPGQGKTHHVIGFALEAAADGERVTYEHARFMLKGPPASSD